jgi:Glycine rich protein
MSPPNSRALLIVCAAAAMIAAGAAPVEARPDPASFTTTCGPTDVSTGAKRCTYTFRYTQTMETFVVPPTTEPVQITAVGAPGGGDPGFRSRGAAVTASFSGLGGMPLFVTVGGEGWFDGYNGGAPGGGGGASDVRLGLPRLDRRIIVAGGGGGWGEQLVFDAAAGLHRFTLVKGGDAGQPGFGAGGGAGTTTAGGDGGGNEPGRGKPGGPGRGGAGGEGIAGGGGGGLFGGGGGGACSGPDGDGSPCLDSQPGSGGGGSSLVPPGGTFRLSDDFEPKVMITVVRYGWWGIP